MRVPSKSGASKTSDSNNASTTRSRSDSPLVSNANCTSWSGTSIVMMVGRVEGTIPIEGMGRTPFPNRRAGNNAERVITKNGYKLGASAQSNVKKKGLVQRGDVITSRKSSET